MDEAYGAEPERRLARLERRLADAEAAISLLAGLIDDLSPGAIDGLAERLVILRSRAAATEDREAMSAAARLADMLRRGQEPVEDWLLS